MLTDRRKQALIEMAKRGTPAEQEIAKSIIDKMGFPIESEEIIETEFTYRNKFEEMLIHQIYAMIINSMEVIYFTSKIKPKTVWFNITKSQEMEMNLFYSIYKREIKEEMEITFNAFIQKNMIFPQCDIQNPKIPNEEQQKKNRKIQDRANTIDKTHVRKQIGVST